MKIVSIDPGLNTGAAVGYCDAITPYRLLERFQIHAGEEGFSNWIAEGHLADADVIVVEKFILANNEFVADTIPLILEGMLIGAQLFGDGVVADVPIIWQPRTDKSVLTGYPAAAKTKAQKQRVRFDFLDRFGMFKAGTENDDSNDAITHALIWAKRAKHYPSLIAFWPPPQL